MRVDPVKLIQFIVCQATEFGASLSPIRVVKFLYLADLYHARENNGKTLTEWPWKFVYFGPYCTESFLALKRAVYDGLIEAKPFESKYDDKEMEKGTAVQSVQQREVIPKKLAQSIKPKAGR
jgi:uncharacterized phage-associated protein